MNKILKWLLAIVGVIVLLLVVAAVVLPLTFDPNNYKEQIREAVKEETGRDMTIAGDIGWTVFPWLGLEVSGITLGNRQGFGNDPMLEVGEAGASVKIMPLFSRKIEIGKITLKDMSVRLSRKANGENNWQDLTDEATAVSASDDSGSTRKPGSNIASVRVSGVEISNANVRWDDAGQVTELNNANLSVSGISDQQPFDMEGSFSVVLSDPAIAGDLRFAGHVIPSAGDSATQIEALTLNFEGQQGITPDLLNLNVEMNTSASFNDKQDSLAFHDFKLRLHNMTVTGALLASSVSTTPEASGHLNIAEFNLKKLMKNMGMDELLTANPDALNKLSLSMDFAASSDEANLQNLNMQLDESSFTGRFKARNFSSPGLDFDLAIDRINLDDYLPPTPEAASNQPGSTQGSPPDTGNPKPSETGLSAKTFRGYSGGGSFRIGELIIAGLTATNVSTKMTADNNGWRFYPTVADFYGGKNQIDIRVDASGDRPMLSINQVLSGVQADGLLQDLTGKASRLLGTGSLTLNIRTDLSNSSTIRSAMSGDMSLNVVDGAFVGFDVADTISHANSLLGKQNKSNETLDNDAMTEFAKLALSGLINNGILSSDDLDMSSTLMRATGKGQINLIDETIDYVVKPVLSENVRGEGKSTLGQLSGVPIPIKITGSVYEPNISIDFVGAITGSQKARIEEKTTELTDKLFDKLLGGDKKPSQQPDAEQPENQSATDDSNAESSSKDNQTDPAEALLNSLFSRKKDKKKTQDTEDSPDVNGSGSSEPQSN